MCRFSPGRKSREPRGYGLYITDITDSVIVFPNASGTTTTPLTGSSFALPDGYLSDLKQYSWAMSSFVGAFESPKSPLFFFQTPASALSAPTANAASSVTTSTLNANWTSIPGASGYRLDVSSSRSFSSFLNGWQDFDAGANTSITVSRLNSSTLYYYRVRAYNGLTISTNSNAIATLTLFNSLAVPTALPATLISSNSFVANWKKVAFALAYRIDVSTTNTFDTFIPGGQDMNAGSGASVLISNLAAETTYYYRVRAANSTGTSSKSATITATTIQGQLSAPIAGDATGVTTTNFIANWTEVADATGYFLDVSTNSAFTNFLSGYENFDVVNTNSENVAGLMETNAYFYRVRAYGVPGVSDYSDTIAVTTLPPPPPAPIADDATNISATSFVAEWFPVTNATAYALDVSTSSNFSTYITGYQNLNVGNVLTKSVTSLRSGTTYYYRLRALGAGGASTNSATISVTTLPTPPAAPVAAAATGTTSGGFTAHWKSSSGATGYQLDVSLTSTFASFVGGYQNLDVGNMTNRSVIGLSGSTAYYYRVRAYGAGGTSGNSGAIKVTTLPNPPAAPVAGAATGVTAGTFAANWTKVAGATGYQLDISTNSSFNTFLSGYQNLNVGNVATKAVSGLRAGAAYYYRLRAYNAGGPGANSGTIAVVTIPPTPVTIAAAGISSGGFVANWNSAAGAAGYRLDVATNSAFTSYVAGWQNLDVGNVLSTNVTGLISSKTYYYRVRAYNSNGSSPSSNTTSVKTQPPAPPALIAAPEGTNLVLSWPTNDPAFKLYYATNIPATIWSSNPVAPSIVLGQYTVTDSLSNTAKFYRLRK